MLLTRLRGHRIRRQEVEMRCAASEKQWYAICVRTGFERVVAFHLEQKGYEQYLPMYTKTRSSLDSVQVVEDFLFPGYVFARCGVLDQLSFLLIPGVISIVRFGDLSGAVPAEELDALKDVAKSGLKYKPSTFITVGQLVSVECGPVRGLRGLCVW